MNVVSMRLSQPKPPRRRKTNSSPNRFGDHPSFHPRRKSIETIQNPNNFNRNPTVFPQPCLSPLLKTSQFIWSPRKPSPPKNFQFLLCRHEHFQFPALSAVPLLLFGFFPVLIHVPPPVNAFAFLACLHPKHWVFHSGWIQMRQRKRPLMLSKRW